MRAAPIPLGAVPPTRQWLAFGAAAVAANLAVAVALASGRAIAAIPLALLPILLLAFGWLLAGHSAVLAYVALGLNFTGLTLLNEPLPLGGGIAIYATDVILLLAVGAWIAERLTRRNRPGERAPLPLAISWPLLALTVFVILAVVQGHTRYGTGLFGQPVRLILYAGIAVALAGTAAPTLWRGITIVFYSGAVVQFLNALYHLAAGGSETDSLTLSTGGTRILALSTATYLVGSLVCALLNLERSGERFSRQIGHAVIAVIAFFGIIVAFGRTIYLAVAVILLALFLTRKALRHAVLLLLPLVLPALIVVILLIPVFAPTLTPTLTSRLGSPPASDINVEWRRRGREASLAGLDQHLLTGFGFGRPVRFVFLGRIQDVTGNPHNSYVYILTGGGVLALASLLAVMLAYVVDVLRRLRRAVGVEQMLLVWSLCTWFAFMVNAGVEPTLSTATQLMTIWILMIVPWVVPVRSRRPESAKSTAPRQAPRSTTGTPVSASVTARS